MRISLSASALVHAAILSLALLGFAWPDSEDAPSPGAVTVDILTVDTISTNQQAEAPTSASQDLVSAGTQSPPSPPIEPLPAERLQPLAPVLHPMLQSRVHPLPAEAVQPSPPVPQALSPMAMISPVPAQAIEPVTPPAAAPAILTATALDSTAEHALVPQTPEAVVPISEVAAAEVTPEDIVPPPAKDARAAPIPHILSRPRPSTPTARPQAPQPIQSSPPPARQAGNGGKNNADSAASTATGGQQGVAGSGGIADTAPWEKQVRRALANARRYPRGANGASGEVTVRFTVSAVGALLDMRILASSGNTLLDQAASDTVSRAAPFPALPAGLASKTVQLPIAFVRN